MYLNKILNPKSFESLIFSERSQDNDLFKSKGHDNIRAVIEILKSDGWKLEKTISSTGDKIQSIQRDFGKVFRLTVSCQSQNSSGFSRSFFPKKS